MTRLLDTIAYTTLMHMLSNLDRMIEVSNMGGAEKYLRDVIFEIKHAIDRLPAVAPMESDTGAKTELIEASFIAECPVHGLFFDAEKAVGPEDCPACARDEETREADKAMVRADMLCDQERDERNSQVHPMFRDVVNAFAGVEREAARMKPIAGRARAVGEEAANG